MTALPVPRRGAPFLRAGLGSAFVAVCAPSAEAQFDPARVTAEPAVIAARFPDPSTEYHTPALVTLAAPGGSSAARPSVLIVAQQHGNEPAGGEAALALVDITDGRLRRVMSAPPVGALGSSVR